MHATFDRGCGRLAHKNSAVWSICRQKFMPFESRNVEKLLLSGWLEGNVTYLAIWGSLLNRPLS